MIRYFLARGDRGGSAMITEGLEDVTCSDPPPRVQIATLYMKTYCTACKREGFISPRGPRRAGTGPNGKQWALSGDINICGCNPAPIFYAERGMTMTFTAWEAAALMGKDGATSPEETGAERYDEQFTLTDSTGRPLEGIRYRVRINSAIVLSGITDANGKTQRISTGAIKRLRLEVAAL
ncbi:hypothetical protein [Paraburkholderia sp.]|jgi:hypothetical protein|uniref:hypothetical protein n=1 Tax=Paraburkholderia sp. TaxID=1926495 RepID=UPI002F40AEA6